ncbi:hypothetical protein, partial [Enterobacter intestinihominis]
AQRRPPFCPVALGLPGPTTPQKNRPFGAVLMSCSRIIIIAVLHIINQRHNNNRISRHPANKKKI